MNLRERLQIRAVVNMIISLIETLASLFVKAQKTFSPKPKVDVPDENPKPHRPRPLKRVVDTIDDIIPLPWRDDK